MTEEGLPVPDTRESKLITMREAVARFVPDGARVALGTFLEQKIPFSAAHEIIRQQRADLELIGPISDIIFDQLIGAGTVRRCRAAWIGNVQMGSAHCFRRAVESGVPRSIEVVDYSNLTLSLALTAGALGVPYMPTRSTLGSRLCEDNPGLKVYEPPFGEQRLVAVEQIRPDVAIIPVQRADCFGNSLSWGAHGVSIEAAHAARHVILVTEELVEEDSIRADPNRNLFPGMTVSAVVHEPWGCHPAPVQGHYNRDHDFYAEYHATTRSVAGFEEWLYRWVTGVADRREYVERLGASRVEGLRIREHAYSPAVDYGF
jgi:glutaconate CoA-transferase subunit A